jgi:uncharacterized protein (TIGR03083 family)
MVAVDFLASLGSDSARFADVLEGVDPTSPVPCCPDWEAIDLLWHLTDVQWFWGTIVDEVLTDPEDAERRKPERPDSHGATLELFRRASDRLQQALSSTAPDTPMWTWHDSDKSAGFIRRRQAHEALIHRVDAEQTAGLVSAVDSALAVDGVDEILTVMIAGIPSWASFEPDGVSVRIEATDSDRHWGLAFGRMQGTSPFSGTTYDLEAATLGLDAPAAQTTIEGRSEDVDLWLWGRADLDRLSVAGDSALADRLREMAAQSTQ